ncbi:DUF6318 family protein [Rothia sp. P5764]|uniref:DUF6318 family protein n=1 Tax=Rothia sp. P5764 TaxID=3402654 RepID=UPI003ACFD4D3
MVSRKTLATPITLVALAALTFTGCGQQKTGSIPEPPTPSSSAVSSSSVTATPSESGDAAEHYSGGSKAPEGEYRQADEQGPAQNVPKPVKPEGMNVESEDGLFKFIGYWNDCVNYGIQTGDFSYAEPLVSDEYTSEREFYIWSNEIYNRKGWIEGGRREAIVGEGLLVAQGDGIYTWGGNLNIEDMRVQLDGPGDLVDWSHTRGQGIYFIAKFEKGFWTLKGVEVVEGQ